MTLRTRPSSSAGATPKERVELAGEGVARGVLADGRRADGERAGAAEHPGGGLREGARILGVEPRRPDRRGDARSRCRERSALGRRLGERGEGGVELALRARDDRGRRLGGDAAPARHRQSAPGQLHEPCRLSSQ